MARKSSSLPWILIALVVLATAAAWWWQTQRGADDAGVDAGAELAPATDPAPPAVRHPVEDIEVAETADGDDALPALGDSDDALREALRALTGGSPALDLLASQHLIGRFVATVDNLPNPRLAPQIAAVRRVPGTLALDPAADGEELRLAEDNAARYTPYVRALEALDPQGFVALYVRHYPLFQEAYRDLGYPDRYFNDRLVEVVDHLLAAPAAPEEGILLRRTATGYAFADPALESASVGHKALWRMGPEHAAAVQAKLRELRALLTGAELPPRG